MARLRRVVALLAMAVGVIAFTGTANAGTLQYEEPSPWAPPYLFFTGSPGETNHLAVFPGPAPVTGTPSIYFRDPGNPIIPDPSQDDSFREQTLRTCTFLGDTAVCSLDFSPVYSVRLGDRNDTASLTGSYADYPDLAVQLVGGPGDDVLRAKGPSASLYGEDGNDKLLGDTHSWMDGGPGADVFTLSDSTATTTAGTVDYSTDFPGPITVTLDGKGNDGGPGEGDNVDPRIYEVDTGGGNDSLTGNAVPGGHYLYASTGDDHLDSGGGTGTLEGSWGADTFTARDGVAQTIECQEGNDTVTADLADTLTDCETVDQS